MARRDAGGKVGYLGDYGGRVRVNACVSRLPPAATSCIHHGRKVMERTRGTLGHLRRRDRRPD